MKLSKDFFEQPTVDVARQLIGCILVFNGPLGLRRARVVETEAYCGPTDLASHASRGKTPRTAPMFGEAGQTYIYLIYGMYFCLNIVTEKENYPAAVLIRALETIDPKEVDLKIASGPGKLCRWLGITKAHNQLDATSEILYIETDPDAKKPSIIRAKRIGVDYAGLWKEKLWRFYDRDSKSVSKK